MKPKLYKFIGVDNFQVGAPIKSWCIPSGAASEKEDKECEHCFNFSYDPYDLLIQGFDDFEDIDYSQKGFIGSDWPLVSLPSIIERVQEVLPSLEIKRVGYSEWNQNERLDGERRFKKSPILQCIFPTVKFHHMLDINSKPCERCEYCGTHLDLKWKSKKGNQFIFPDYNKWEGDEIFYIPYFGYRGVLVTDSGIEKLNSAGVKNLDLEEIQWGESK